MKQTPPTVVARLRRGFSLVEVVIAVGIAASTVTLMIGLLPAGLSNFREAMNVTVSSQLGQRLLYEAAQTDYTTLTATPLTKPWRYFDEEGTELPGAAGAAFHVLTRVQPTTAIPTTAGGVAQPNLATVIVQVALNPGGRVLPLAGAPGSNMDPPEGTVAPEAGVTVTTFTGHVARTL